MTKTRSVLMLGAALLSGPALAGNSGVIVQGGGLNTADTYQRGHDNVSQTVQFGDDNLATTTQRGRNNHAEIGQEGTINDAVLDQRECNFRRRSCR
jgi:hypothetical protein